PATGERLRGAIAPRECGMRNADCGLRNGGSEGRRRTTDRGPRATEVRTPPLRPDRSVRSVRSEDRRPNTEDRRPNTDRPTPQEAQVPVKPKDKSGDRQLSALRSM